MELSKYKEDYYFFSGKTSEIVRQLALAGIAVIWIFHFNDNTKPVVPRNLIVPIFLFAITLSLDLLQYVYATIAWGIFHRYNEKKKVKKPQDNPNLLAPSWMNWPTLFFFTAKILAVFSAYFIILSFLWHQWIK
jgi:hypothetical protein